MKNPYKEYPFVNNHYAKMFLNEELLRTGLDMQCNLRYRPDKIRDEILDRTFDKSRWPAFLHSHVEHCQFLFANYAPIQFLEKWREKR